MLKHTLQILCLFSALGLGALPALAQARSSSADLTGVVMDPTKTYVPGGTVTATNLATGLARSGSSHSEGVYRIPLLPPGIYDVKIEVNGFNSQIKRGVTLTVGQTLTLNF